jgi:hypothetical protein
MESMDHIRECFTALEQQRKGIGAHTRTVERRRRCIASLYRCLRLQVGSLALAGSKSHGGCGAYYSACLLACLLLVEYVLC